MPQETTESVLDEFVKNCTECGCCQIDCVLLRDLGMYPSEIAKAILTLSFDEKLIAAVLRCDLCGRCALSCEMDLNPSKLFKAAREIMMQNGYIQPNDYDVMLTDQEWNFFSYYQDTYHIHFDDLMLNSYDVLFFPGCTLATYSPELTRAAYDWLKQQGMRVSITTMCCGKPLESIGLSARADRLLDRLRTHLDAGGARKIVTACPNCEALLRVSLSPEIEVVSIYYLMVEAGVHLAGVHTLTFHDSCPDRYRSKNPDYVRAILSGYPQVEMSSQRQNTICCGSGGIVSMIDPDLCTSRSLKRIDEFLKSGADNCVTSCMSCAHRLAHVGKPGQIRHCLEYVFNYRVDYSQIEQNIQRMWNNK